MSDNPDNPDNPDKSPPPELKPSLLLTIGKSVGCVLLSIIWWINWGETVEYGWVVVLFLGIGAVYYFAQNLPGACFIRLYPQGFELTTMYTLKRYAWKDISQFQVRRSFGPFVQFDHTKEDGTEESVKIYETFGMSIIKFVNLMNDWREKGAAAAEPRRTGVWKSKDH